MTERIDPAVTAKIIQALASYLKRDPASITEAHHLRDDLGLDSVAIIELFIGNQRRRSPGSAAVNPSVALSTTGAVTVPDGVVARPASMPVTGDCS